MATMTCPNCGREVPAEATTCPHCGQRLDGIGVEGPPPDRDPPPEAVGEAADPRVRSPDAPDDDAFARDEPTEDVVAEPDGVPPAAAAAGEPEPRTTTTDTSARPATGVRWSAVVAGFLTILAAGFVLSFLLSPGVAVTAALIVGLVVAYRTAPHRKLMHAALAGLLYYLVAFLIGLVMSLGGVPGGAAGP